MRSRHEAEAPHNQRYASRLRASLLGRPLILSVDRLDYSKGLRPRFIAFERFLERYPRHQAHVVFMQIAPPSRGDIETYREIRRELEAEAGRINGRFAEVDWMPLRYLNRGFARSALMPLYAEAQVGLVTPLRDGMNLVAKEYVAAQDPDNPGVLVLSQFAGAARELDAALIVNPYDEAGVAAALDRGLAMECDERRERHAAMLRGDAPQQPGCVARSLRGGSARRSCYRVRSLNVGGWSGCVVTTATGSTGIGSSSVTSKSRISMASTSVASASANCAPTQTRGPAPNGR